MSMKLSQNQMFSMCTNLPLTVDRSFYSIPVDVSFSNKAGHCQSLKCSEINVNETILHNFRYSWAYQLIHPAKRMKSKLRFCPVFFDSDRIFNENRKEDFTIFLIHTFKIYFVFTYVFASHLCISYSPIWKCIYNVIINKVL